MNLHNRSEVKGKPADSWAIVYWFSITGRKTMVVTALLLVNLFMKGGTC